MADPSPLLEGNKGQDSGNDVAAAPSPSQLRQNLQELAHVASMTGDYPLALFNIATLADTYRGVPGLQETVKQFRESPAAHELMAARYSALRELLPAIIARNRGEGTAPDEQQLLLLARGKAVFTNTFPGVRAQAVLALTTMTLTEADRQNFVDYLAEQYDDPDGRIFRAARTALAKMGTDAQKQHIIAELTSPDAERAMASVIAVGSQRLSAGREALRSLSGSLSADPEVVQAARAFVDEWDAEVPTEPPTIIWAGGVTNPDLKIHVITSVSEGSWYHVQTDGLDQVLQVDYPGNVQYEYIQFAVPQSSVQQPTTVDYSRYSELTVEIKAAEPGQILHLGYKGIDDPQKSMLVDKNLDNIPTDRYKRYHILLDKSDPSMLQRLQTLQIPLQLSFDPTSPQTFYIRRISYGPRSPVTAGDVLVK